MEEFLPPFLLACERMKKAATRVHFFCLQLTPFYKEAHTYSVFQQYPLKYGYRYTKQTKWISDTFLTMYRCM